MLLCNDSYFFSHPLTKFLLLFQRTDILGAPVSDHKVSAYFVLFTRSKWQIFERACVNHYFMFLFSALEYIVIKAGARRLDRA